MKVRRIDHVGIVVQDLSAATAFFLELGLELYGESHLEGELLERVVGLPGAKTEFVWLRTPDQQMSLEIIKFLAPADNQDVQQLPANALGIRHIAFAVDDIEAIVARLKKKGTKTFSEIQNYKDTYKLCYVRGPEGMIVELAEQIKE